MTTMIEIGDKVRTTKSIKNVKSVLLAKGSVGKVSDFLRETKAGPKFLVEFERMPFNFWADELELVKKGKPSERKKPRPEPTIHRQKVINLGGMTFAVDIKLAALIRGLFLAGILTSMSCQENKPGITWLQFINTDHALRFVNKASKVVDSFIWKNDGVLIDPDDDYGTVSIRFPLADLPKLKRLFPTD